MYSQVPQKNVILTELQRQKNLDTSTRRGLAQHDKKHPELGTKTVARRQR